MNKRVFILSLVLGASTSVIPARASKSLSVTLATPIATSSHSTAQVAASSGLSSIVVTNGGGTTVPGVYGSDTAVAYCMHWEPMGMPQTSTNWAEATVGYGGLAIWQQSGPPASSISMTWVEMWGGATAVVADATATAKASIVANGSYTVANSELPNDGLSDGSSTPNSSGYDLYGWTYSYPPVYTLMHSNWYAWLEGELHARVDNTGHQGFAMQTHLYSEAGNEMITLAGCQKQYSQGGGGGYLTRSFGDLYSGGGSTGVKVRAEGSSATTLWHAATASYMRSSLIEFN